MLKSHRKRSGKTQPEDAAVLLAAIQDYLPYLSALNVGIHGRLVNGEVVNAEIKVEATVHWRSTLLQPAPSRPSIRVKGKTVDFEVCFVLTTLAYIYNAQARTQLLALYGPVTPSPEQRTAAITAATKLLLEAAGVHLYLSSFCVETDAFSGVLETLAQTQAGLSALALAEATLLAVLKDDPYPAVVAQDRNKNDREWMIKPPEIPKVRAHLFARLCLAAADHAGKAEAMFRSSGRMDEDLVVYASNLKKTARARACRFFGIDAELGGETGKAIAWLMGGKKQLGFSSSSDAGSKLKGIAKLKKDWTERREDKKVERGEEWGSDAGKFEEGRVIEMLEQKWNKMNDTVRLILSIGISVIAELCDRSIPSSSRLQILSLQICPPGEKSIQSSRTCLLSWTPTLSHKCELLQILLNFTPYPEQMTAVTMIGMRRVPCLQVPFQIPPLLAEGKPVPTIEIGVAAASISSSILTFENMFLMTICSRSV